MNHKYLAKIINNTSQILLAKTLTNQCMVQSGSLYLTQPSLYTKSIINLHI